MTTSRNFIVGGVAATSAGKVLPLLGHATAHGASFDQMDGKILIHPVARASFAMENAERCPFCRYG